MAAAKKGVAPSVFDVKTITLDDLLRVFEMQSYRRPRKSASDLPDAPFKVEDVPPTLQSEISHFRSHYKNPDRVEGVLTLKLPEALRKRGRKDSKTKKPSGNK
ncbi:hypothetical protein [Polaromonas sp.]|uniref:hypothetical protein n=1 Tax=Polaromonas sp. TaxID=1869339 RepID=UPI002FCA7008